MKVKKNSYIVYLNRDLNGEVFYVGYSKGYKRPYDKYSVHKGDPLRSKAWYDRCKNQFTVEIVYKNLSKELAWELEKLLIAKYGRVKYDVGGILVNEAIGGKGCNGVIRSKETKEAISKALKGMVRSTDTKLKISESTKGCKNHRAKKVICTKTGAIWLTIRECAIGNNMKQSTLTSKLNGTRVNDTSFKTI